MQYCVDHPEEMNKISKIKSQVAEVKGIMMDNIEKVLNFLLMHIVDVWLDCACIVSLRSW